MNYRMWHFRGEYIFENTIVRMQIAICDDEKSIGLILEEKIKKLLPDAVIETYLSGDELIASGCKPDMLFWISRCRERMGWKRQGFCVRRMTKWMLLHKPVDRFLSEV